MDNDAPTVVRTYETHLVVSIEATIHRHSDGTYSITYDRPEVCVENPFPQLNGPLYDSDDCEWYTVTQAADRDALPMLVTQEVAIGPDVTVELR